MNLQDFEKGEDILRALETAQHWLSGALNNLKQHSERLRGVDETRTDALDKMTAERDAVVEERDTARWAVEAKDRQLIEHIEHLKAVEKERDRYKAALEKLGEVASDHIDFDYENQVPVCHCCGMELDMDGKGHKCSPPCLANLILEALQPAQKDAPQKGTK